MKEAKILGLLGSGVKAQYMLTSHGIRAGRLGQGTIRQGEGRWWQVWAWAARQNWGGYNGVGRLELGMAGRSPSNQGKKVFYGGGYVHLHGRGRRLEAWKAWQA